MSNYVLFKHVANRARIAEEGRVSLNQSVSLTIPASVLVFAAGRLDMLEKQILKQQNELVELRAISASFMPANL